MEDERVTPLPAGSLVRFAEAVVHDDIDVAMLRGFLWIERGLVLYISCKLPRLPSKTVDRLPFPTKVEMASALGAFPTEHCAAFFRFGQLRNGLAHRLDRPITAQDEKSLYDALAPDQRTDMSGHALPIPGSVATRHSGRAIELLSLRTILLKLVTDVDIALGRAGCDELLSTSKSVIPSPALAPS